MIVRVLLAILLTASAARADVTQRYGWPLTNDQNTNNLIRAIEAQVNRGHSLHPAGSGDIQLGNDDTICFRNATNTADCCLNMGGTNALSFSGGCTITGTGGGAGTFDAIGSGTNVTATMTCGTGCTMQASGSGTIAASTANLLTATPTNCSNNQATPGVGRNGNSQNCFQPALISGTPVANQLGVWTNATTQTGYPDLVITSSPPAIIVGVAADGSVSSRCTSASNNCKADFVDIAASAPAAPGAGFTRVYSSGGRLGQIPPGGSGAFFSTASSTDTFTNKTFNTAGFGNSFQIASRSIAALSGNTGTLATTSGSFTASNCARWDANGNLVDAGTTCGGGSTPRLDQVLDPNTNKAFVMGANTLTMTWNAATGASVDLHVLTDTASNTGTGHVLAVRTAGSSAAKPFIATAQGSANGVEMSTTGVLSPIGTGAIQGRWSDLQNPIADLSLTLANNSTFQISSGKVYQFSFTGAAAGQVVVTDTGADASAGPILLANTSTGSTANIFAALNNNTNGVQVSAAGVLAPVGTGKVAPRLNDVTNTTAAWNVTDAFGTTFSITSGSSNGLNFAVSTNNTGTQDKITDTDFSGNTGTGYLHRINTVGTSTMKPLGVFAQGTANGVAMDSTAVLRSQGTGQIAVSAGGGNVSLTGQTANISATNAIASAPAGQYMVCCYTKVTTTAGTSSTLPNCRVTFTDGTDSVVLTNTISGTNSGNTTVSSTFACQPIDIANNTAIQYSTTSYASNPAATMQYKLTFNITRLN